MLTEIGKTSLTPHLHDKYCELTKYIEALQGAIVALSGGVDSSLLAAISFNVLKERVLAVTADSPSLPRSDLELSKKIAGIIGIKHRIVATNELDNPEYVRNAKDRCYHCKSTLSTTLENLSREYAFSSLLIGNIADDQGDYRPGLQAGIDRGNLSPLLECGFTKKDVRELAKAIGLPNWDKPAMACLSSRIPYGERVSKEKLSQIEAAEKYFHDLGFSQVRVRHHGSLARIEVPSEDILRVCAPETRKRIDKYFKELGFTFISVDLKGYVSGSLNKLLTNVSSNTINGG